MTPSSPSLEPDLPRDPLILVEDPITRGHEWTWLRPLLDAAFRARGVPVRVADSGTGHGRAESAPGLATEDIEEGGWYPCHVIASKFGCAAALRLATDRPDLVRSLVLHDPVVSVAPGPSSMALESVSEHLLRLATAFADPNVDSVDFEWGRLLGEPMSPAPPALFVGERTRADLDGVVGLLSSPRTWEVPSVLDEFLGPVLVVDGDRSPRFIRSAGDRIASRLPNVRRLTLHEAGALLPTQDPARFAAIVMSFCLERTVPGA